MITSPDNAAGGSAVADDLDRAAFDRTAAARSAMSVADAPLYNLDAFHACNQAQWIAPRMAPYRAAMVALSGFDASHLDTLEDLGRGLRFVEAELRRRVASTKEMPALLEEGFQLRSLMMLYAETLVLKGHFAPALVAKLREGAGSRDLVEDLTILAREFRALPAARIGPDAPVSTPEIARADEIANEIGVRIGRAAEIDLSHTALIDERRKLAGLLLQAHSQIRRAMTYLRWDAGDVGELVPSLHVPAGRRTAAPAEDLAALHHQLHEHDAALPPEDNPFTTEG